MSAGLSNDVYFKSDPNWFSGEVLTILGKITENRRFRPAYRGNDMLTHFFYLQIFISNERSRRDLLFCMDSRVDQNGFSEEMLKILGKITENHRFRPVYWGNDMAIHFFTLTSSYQMKDLIEIYYSVLIQKWIRTDLVEKLSEYGATPPKIVGGGMYIEEMICLPTFLHSHLCFKWKISSSSTILYGFKSGSELILWRKAQNTGKTISENQYKTKLSRAPPERGLTV